MLSSRIPFHYLVVSNALDIALIGPNKVKNSFGQDETKKDETFALPVFCTYIRP